MKKSKIAVSGGHAVIGSRGASGLLDEVKKDRLLTKEVVKELKRRGYTAKNLSVRKGTQNEVLNRLYEKHSKFGGDLNISIHLNAGGGYGFEVLTVGQRTDVSDFCKHFCKLSHFRNRGVKDGHELFFCRRLKNSILLEVGFVDNYNDFELWKKLGAKKIATYIVDSLEKSAMIK